MARRNGLRVITYGYRCSCGDYDSKERTGALCPKCGKEGKRLFVVHFGRGTHPTKGKA